jgi:hypothetical protein
MRSVAGLREPSPIAKRAISVKMNPRLSIVFAALPMVALVALPAGLYMLSVPAATPA